MQQKTVSLTSDESAILVKWMTKAYGGWHRKLDFKRVNKAIDYEDNILDWLKEQKNIESLLVAEILDLNLTDSMKRLQTPLLCLAGKDINIFH